MFKHQILAPCDLHKTKYKGYICLALAALATDVGSGFCNLLKIKTKECELFFHWDEFYTNVASLAKRWRSWSKIMRSVKCEGQFRIHLKANSRPATSL